MVQTHCNACGQPLLIANLLVCDGCPCNSANGVNFPPLPCAHCREACTRPGHHLDVLFGGTVGVEPSVALAMLRDGLARAEGDATVLRAQLETLTAERDAAVESKPTRAKLLRELRSARKLLDELGDMTIEELHYEANDRLDAAIKRIDSLLGNEVKRV